MTITDETESDSGLDALIWQIGEQRRRVEREGAQYRGCRWHGDADGRQSVTETIAAVEAMPEPGGFTTSWKCLDGWLDSVTLDDLRTVRGLLAQRRQACFARQRELVLAAEAGEIVDLGAGWPQ